MCDLSARHQRAAVLSWFVALCTILPLVISSPAAAQAKGEVTLSAKKWYSLWAKLGKRPAKKPPPVAYAYLDRALEGTFRKGLLRATLTARFEVLDDSGFIELPIVNLDATFDGVALDGKPAMVVRRKSGYVLLVKGAGVHQLTAKLLVGRELDRFARRLTLKLPKGGRTRLSIAIPERDIRCRLGRGVLVSSKAVGASTIVAGYLDASGQLALSWARKNRHEQKGRKARWEARQHTLFSVDQALVRGLSVFDVSISEGETDRIDLLLPTDVEVLSVSGKNVLQWQTTGTQRKRRLAVLLRGLARRRVQIAIRFQRAVTQPNEVKLPIIVPPRAAMAGGVLGVSAPAGLDVAVEQAKAAKALDLRDLPTALTQLTRNPLLFGYRFKSYCALLVRVRQHRQVKLTSTLIDDIQASTVLVADGQEITKLRLKMRNNTRQYLCVELPRGAVLTHSLIDGHPVRPAAEPQRNCLLFPLRQSERVDPKRGRRHTVAVGETLGDLAHQYLGSPSKWPILLNANRHILASAKDLQVGQKIRIPLAGPVSVKESRFVLELSYRRHRPLAVFGRIGKRRRRIGKRRRGWQGGGLCLLSTRLAERRSEQPVSSREASDNARRPASGARGAGPRGGRAIESLRGAERS
jgi:hypothetical protein